MRIKSPKSSFALRALAIAALLLGASNTAALANPDDRVSFREFRQQNDGLDRNVVRRMYHQQFGRNAANGPLRTMPLNTPNVITVGADGLAMSGGAINNRIPREPREARVRPMSMQQLANGGLTRVNRGVDLDLSSNSRNIVLGQGLFGTAAGSSVDINLDGKNATYTAGSVVTAAEYVAVKQVLEGGGQQVQIDRAGRASGGTVDLSALTSGNSVMRASSLVVPTNVTTYGDFAKGSDFRLSGQLSNYGTVQVLSSDSSVRGGAIRANDISNHTGALISSTTDLHLDATRNFTNYGDVLSTQGLTISAGGELKNAGRISSNNDLTINSSNVTNRGVISSNLANVNLASSGDIVVNNNRGTISAVNGAINVRDAAYTGLNNSYVNGGDLVSKELNLNSGVGTANVAVNQLTGVINGTGTASHVLASTDMLNVGNVCLTGDPTFYNTAGGIIISDDVVVQEDLVFIAAGGITSLADVTIQAGDATKGYNITFISGSTFTASGGKSTPIVGAPPYADSGSVTISNRASKIAAGIALGLGTLVSSRSTDNTGNKDAGDISFFSFGKSTIINLSDARIESGGQKLGKNGDVLIVNGGTNKTQQYTIRTAGIDTTNQDVLTEGAGGALTIVTAVPTISGAKTVVYDANGIRQGPGFLTASTKLVKGDVALQNNPSLPTTDIEVAGALTVKSGQITDISTPVVAKTASLTANFFQQTIGSGIVKADSVELITAKGGFVGTGPFDGLTLDTGLVNVNSPGGFVSLDLQNTGITTVNTASAASVFIVDGGINRELQGNASATSTMILRGLKITPTGNFTSGDVLTLVSTSSPLLNSDASKFSAKYMILSAPSIGTDEANPFVLNSKVSQVDIVDNSASVASAFVRSTNTKSILVGTVAITGNLNFRANSGISLGVNSDSFPEIQSTSGKLDFSTTAGVLAINKNIDIAAVAGIDIVNTGTTTRDKLTFAANSTVKTSTGVAGQGNINLGLGLKTSAIPDPANPVVTETGTGLVTFYGNGVSAKGAVSAAQANNANLDIFNSVNVRNFTLSGNNTFSATKL